MLVHKRQSTSPNYARRLEAWDIGSLRIFCTVVETGSFSAAARALNVAASTISKHISGLEHALERPLIQRTTRQLSVTAEGKAFFEQCQIALEALNIAVDTQRPKASAVSGRIRVTAPPALSQTMIGPHLAEFVRRFPGISLEYSVTAASLDLVAEGIDIAIRIDDQPCGKYPVIPLGDERRVFCASPKFIEDNGAPGVPDELSQFNCLVNVYSGHQHMWPVRVGQSDSVVPINGTFACNSGDIIRRLCLDGVGIGLFSYSYVRDDLERGDLVEILHDYQMPKRSIFALVAHKKYMNDCAGSFIDFIRDVIRRSDGREPSEHLSPQRAWQTEAAVTASKTAGLSRTGNSDFPS